jgi:hypothetical protein
MINYLVAALVAFGAMTSHARPVVVELFTSQGCSSCPPADAVLARLASQKEVIAISWPVTYWDRLGWKDTLARPSNTKRQYEYAAALRENGVYTPQAIIDGVTHVVGSQAQQLATLIAARRTVREEMTLSVERTTNGGLFIKTSAAPETVDIRLVSLKASETVAVGRGENSQRKLSYTNIAMADDIVGSGKQAQNLSLTAPPSDRIAVLVESRKTRAILAAALLQLK